jgi:hypothetical protein
MNLPPGSSRVLEIRRQSALAIAGYDRPLATKGGSIGVQFEGWHWGIDSVIPMRDAEKEGGATTACGSSERPGTTSAPILLG